MSSETVWLAMSGDVESARVEGVYATREAALEWLVAERERQIAKQLEDWEWRQERYAPDNEEEIQSFVRIRLDHPRRRRVRALMKKAEPTEAEARAEVLEWFARERAQPPVGMTEIADDRFVSTEGSILGWWRIDEWPVLIAPPVHGDENE